MLHHTATITVNIISSMLLNLPVIRHLFELNDIFPILIYAVTFGYFVKKNYSKRFPEWANSVANGVTFKWNYWTNT